MLQIRSELFGPELHPDNKYGSNTDPCNAIVLKDAKVYFYHIQTKTIRNYFINEIQKYLVDYGTERKSENTEKQ